MRPPVTSEGERGGGVRVGEGRMGWAGEGERSKSREGGGEVKRVAHKGGGGLQSVRRTNRMAEQGQQEKTVLRAVQRVAV